jgi:TrpR family transcriptional regulator, trp operon repressor
VKPSIDPCGELAEFMRRPQSEEELTRLLKVVLTPAEIESISQRLCILDGIASGVPQREIAEGLRVGIATVTRGSRVWQENRNSLKTYFPRSIADTLDAPQNSSPQLSRQNVGVGTALPLG